MDKNLRNPSPHHLEEPLFLNFVKHNRKLINKGEMKDERVEKFEKLLALCEKYKIVNQYA